VRTGGAPGLSSELAQLVARSPLSVVRTGAKACSALTVRLGLHSLTWGRCARMVALDLTLGADGVEDLAREKAS
jgi:hypothetical protein